MSVIYSAGFDMSLVDFDLWIGTSGKTTIKIGYSGKGAGYINMINYDTNASTKWAHHDFHGMVTTDKSALPFSTTWCTNSLAYYLNYAVANGMFDNSWVGTMTVSFSNSTGKYTFDYGATAFTVQPKNQETARLLGWYYGSKSVSGSLASEYDVKHIIVAGHDHISKASDEFEPGKIASMAVSDSGQTIGLSRSTAIVYLDWTQQFESQHNTFQRLNQTAVSTSPPGYSWQEFFDDNRTKWPFMVLSSDYEYTGYYPICILRPEGSNFKPERDHPDYSGYWHIPFKTILLGWYEVP